MKIRCINNDKMESKLTVDKIYEVIDETVDFYYVCNDNGVDSEYFKNRFIGDKESKGNIIEHPLHYTQGIECWDYIVSHSMGYLEGNIIKYVTRYKDKNGAEDLRKAQAYLNKLIETVDNNNK